MREFCENKVLNIVGVELGKQLKLHLSLHSVTHCFTYAIDDNDPQAGAVVRWGRLFYIPT